MPVELVLCIVVTILMGKGDIKNCCSCRAMKLLEHGMEVVERMLEKKAS